MIWVLGPLGLGFRASGARVDRAILNTPTRPLTQEEECRFKGLGFREECGRLRGSIYKTIRDLGPKIPYCRRNCGSQIPNGCICGLGLEKD